MRESTYAKAATSLISTLNAVDNLPQLYLNRHVLERAIYRYEHIWIPLLTRVPRGDRVKLVPPLDVEWVWMCHMLAPQIYAIDSAAVWNAHAPFEDGYVVDHAILGERARQDGLVRAESRWRLHFPDEPFNILAEIDAAPLTADTASSRTRTADAARPRSRIKYDIIAAAERQMAFHYQVAITPHYRHDEFLRTAAARYKKFLRLFKNSATGLYVPTYDIDLMWHTHQLHPRLYARETKKVAGRLLPHDDTLNDRTEGAELSQRWGNTRKRWKDRYGSHICRAGGMFRGDITPVERRLRSRLEADVADIVSALPDGVRHDYTMTIRPRRESVVTPPTAGDVEWVHLADLRKAQRAGGEAALRTSRLAIEGTEVRLKSRVTNAAARKDVAVHSAVEIFDARNAQSSANALPLASAHVAPEGSAVLHEPARQFRPLAEQGETLVLRVAGRDVALLAGCWNGYVMPVSGVKGVSGRRETRLRGVPEKKGVSARPGALRLTIAFLGERPQWTPLMSDYERDGLTPPVVVIGDRKSYRLRVDLAAGTVRFRDKTDAVLAGVVGMAAALLHVRLQPRFQPASGRRKTDSDSDSGNKKNSNNSNNSLYPTWMVQQQAHAALTAAGGEWQHGQQLVGYGHMLERVAAAHRTPRSTKLWPTTQDRVPASFSRPEPAKMASIGTRFGPVSGYEWEGSCEGSGEGGANGDGGGCGGCGGGGCGGGG